MTSTLIRLSTEEADRLPHPIHPTKASSIATAFVVNFLIFMMFKVFRSMSFLAL